jgi:preprotein translocase subunit SecA
VLGVDLPVEEWAKEEGIADEEVRERASSRASTSAPAAKARNGPDVMRYVEKILLLQTLDHSGASICVISIICARASACAATASAIR